jgi:PQQ-dependent dehydrogenase (s-GDH family)
MHAVSPPARRTLALVLLSLSGWVWAQNPPETALRGTKRFRKRVVTSRLAGPWEITWGPDNMLWVTERTGKRIIRVDPATGARRTAITLQDVSAPGGQDGLLGLALHPELLKGTGNDFVYAAYTSEDRAKGPDPTATGRKNRYRYLYMRAVRFTYDAARERLSNPTPLLTGLPAGDDHNAGRLKFGPDRKLYLTLGDQGHNQFGNFCLPIESQRLPTQAEVAAKDYSAYAGKTLRINLDGSIPADNPRLAGAVSHVYTYGHRNPQGLSFAPDGTLYSSEHGPKSDDEVNILKPGANYGWPHIAGFRDDKAYAYARWAQASTPCRQLQYNDFEIPESVPREPESAFREAIAEPVATLFTVPSGFNFQSPACQGFDFICWPTVGIGSLEYYESNGGGIPGWDRALLVTALKRGSLYVLPLRAGGQAVEGPIYRYFHSENRYRDVEAGPDRKTIYIATDPGGVAESLDGGVTSSMQDPGAILEFTYEGEEATSDASETAAIRPAAGPLPATPRRAETAGAPPQFTAQQTASGKAAYQSRCAVCHGTTLTNGTYGTPLAGEYFHKKWSGKTVGALLEKSKTMPPSSPSSLRGRIYADIVAYILEANGATAGQNKLPASGPALNQMTIP